MKRYQEPEMELIRFEAVNTTVETSPGGLYVPGDGSNTGGNEGTGSWDGL